MFSLAHSIVSSLLSSQGGTIFDSLGQESNIFDSGGKLSFGISEETLGIDDSLFTLSLRSGVRVSLVSSTVNFSVTGDEILVMLGISGFLFSTFLSNQFVDKSNNIINDTFGSEVNL